MNKTFSHLLGQAIARPFRRRVPKLVRTPGCLRHKATGNEILFTQYEDGFAITYREHGQYVANATGVGIDDFANNLVDWVRRGYKA